MFDEFRFGGAVDKAMFWDNGGIFNVGSPVSTVTISIATPGVISWVAHGLIDGDPVVLSTTGAMPTGLTAGTQYYIAPGSLPNSFFLSTTKGGAAITTSGTQSGVHTATSISPLKFIPFSAGAPDGYWRVGGGSILKYSAVTANWLRIGCNSTFAGAQFGIRCNDGISSTLLDKPTMATDLLGKNYISHRLPLGLKTVDIIAPVQFSSSAGGPIFGCYPFDVRFDGPATPVAPVAQTYRLAIISDSIGSGSSAANSEVFGIGGQLKRGLAVQTGTAWKGAWSSVTAYAIGNCVSLTTGVWRAKTANTNVSPIVGADWQYVGWNGAVFINAYGTRRVNDEAVTAASAAAFAAALGALGITHILWLLGTNDHSVVGPVLVATHQIQVARLLDAIHVTLPTVKICGYTPLRRNTETANSAGEFMSQFRTAQTTEFNARSGWSVPPSIHDGLSLLTTAQFTSDLTHPWQLGHEIWMADFQAVSGF